MCQSETIQAQALGRCPDVNPMASFLLYDNMEVFSMNSSSSSRSGLRAFLVAATFVLLAASSALAQRPAGPPAGGGGGRGGYHGPSTGGGYHGSGPGYQGGRGYYGGHGYHGGGHGYYGPGWGWGWGGGWGWGLGWGGWGWGYPGWGYGYGAYGYPGWGGYYGGYGAFAPGDWAIIATDVSPETTRVFLDGVFIGMVDDFDGPDFLYLKKGDYLLEFRLDGFETKTVNLSAQQGAQMRISEKLKKIPGAPQYGSYDNPEPEGGVQRYWAKERNASSHPANPQEGSGQAHPWQGYGEPSQGAQSGGGQAPGAPESGSEVAMDPAMGSSLAKSRGRLIFRITPGDAAVYVNDHFVGTGEELSTLNRGFLVQPGQHSITVSRPGLETREETVVVGPGKSETVEIALQRK